VSISSISARSALPPQSEGARDVASFAPISSGFEVVSTLTSWSNAPSRDEGLEKSPSPAQISHAVNQVNNAFVKNGQDLFASIEKDKDTGIHVVKLLDTSTKEVVSQYPSKQIVAIAAALTQFQEGKGQLLNTLA
jgi:flagellar protein FlaG